MFEYVRVKGKKCFRGDKVIFMVKEKLFFLFFVYEVDLESYYVFVLEYRYMVWEVVLWIYDSNFLDYMVVLFYDFF